MVGKTALYTFVSTVVIAVAALTVEKSGVHFGPQPPVSSLSGASVSWSPDGQRGDWGGSAYVSGASSSYSSGGARGNWGRNPYISGASVMRSGDDDEHRFGSGDHDGWGGGDD